MTIQDHAGPVPGSGIGASWPSPRPLTLPAQDPAEPSNFSSRLAVLPSFLPEDEFQEIQRDAEQFAGQVRSYIPAHKKGGTIAYETILREAPRLADLYHSAFLRNFLSKLIGLPVVPTPLHDQSSLSVLVYDRPGDHIGWHFDHNFYRGRHFTVLLTVVNQGSSESGLSHARLIARLPGGERTIETAPNTLVVFEGAEVCHKVIPIKENERRIVVSMTFCTDPRNSWWQDAARRVKDIAFFGVKALWM